MRGHTALESIFEETLFLDQFHNFSLSSLNSFLHPFLKSKFNYILLYYRELCNLCTERAERNVPVYTREAEEAADKMAARVLVNAEQRRGFLFFIILYH